MHGGLSTGPRTPEGLERSRRARWVHGRFSREAIEARRRANWETLEQAMRRFQRQAKREERQMARESRRFRTWLNRLLGPVD
jgi:signal transduction histidine kinase